MEVCLKYLHAYTDILLIKITIIYIYVAADTVGEICGTILPLSIISVTVNILRIAALVIVVIVVITARRKSDRVCYARIFMHWYYASSICMFLL